MQNSQLIQRIAYYYVDSLLWSIEVNFDRKDLSPDAVTTIIEDCTSFVNAVIEKYGSKFVEQYQVELGHDFCMTRNGEGLGFWDGDWDQLTDDNGDWLTELANTYHQINPYYGDDNQIYLEKENKHV